MDLKITVHRIEGRCPVYRLGDEFLIRDGYQLEVPKAQNLCMHSLASIMPYYVALSSGVTPHSLGLSNSFSSGAFLQCLDPADVTGGGTVTFYVECVG